jgi:hypothetical protein
MKFNKERIMKRIFLLITALMGLHFPAHAFQETNSIQIPDMRFYAVKAINLQSSGAFDLLAVGQINHDGRNEGLLIALSVADDSYKEIAREVFSIGDKGETGDTRIRSMVCIKEPSSDQYLVVVNGKGGPKNREDGFIRSYLFKGTFNMVDHIEFSDPETAYTHGYPLIQADVDGDGNNEIVYGGFSGENDRDHADIRIFSIGTQGHLSPLKGFDLTRLNSLRLRINTVRWMWSLPDGRLKMTLNMQPLRFSRIRALSGRNWLHWDLVVIVTRQSWILQRTGARSWFLAVVSIRERPPTHCSMSGGQKGRMCG